MSELWATRQRDTNRLVRLVAPFVLNSKKISPDQLYGICKLTWITTNSRIEDAPYIKSTKIPALGHIFQRDFKELTLDQVATFIAEVLDDPTAVDVVKQHTGFTNFYKAYRNASRIWIQQNLNKLVPLFKTAFSISTDGEGQELASKLAQFDGITKPGNSQIKMQPAYLLTPAFFALDSRLRFPMINGNQGVKRLLKSLQVSKSPLETQYSRMIELYGNGGIIDAADLDQAGHDLPDFMDMPGMPATKQLLAEQPSTGDELPLKDEHDVISVISAQKVSSKRLHNSLTNKLRSVLNSFVLYEGRNKEIMFDAMVKNFDSAGNDLLIEVKSSTEIAHLRMAVGQLFSYSYRLNFGTKNCLAVLLPEKPETDITKWLACLGIGVLWFAGNDLCTSDHRLLCIAKYP